MEQAASPMLSQPKIRADLIRAAKRMAKSFSQQYTTKMFEYLKHAITDASAARCAAGVWISGLTTPTAIPYG